MTDENIKINIHEELKRASVVFDAAVVLFDNGFINDAVSRLYYFVLYHVRALLLSKGLEPRTHEGALRLFAQHFVKTKIFKAGDSHVFSKLMKYREEADYNPAYEFTKNDFSELKNDSEGLAVKIKSYLEDNGYC